MYITEREEWLRDITSQRLELVSTDYFMSRLDESSSHEGELLRRGLDEEEAMKARWSQRIDQMTSEMLDSLNSNKVR
ncbi:MAG: hypothetical protein ACR2GY_06210 [Phycisphaerales bacterium]